MKEIEMARSKIPRGWSLYGLLLASLATVTTAVAAPDCAQGQRDLASAKQRITASADDEATVLLNQSIDECPTYDAYETLGEHLAVSDSPRDHGFAVEAFVHANALAPSKKEGAQALFQYAALLNRTGDPENAYPLIQRAATLDPNRASIKTLAADIRTKVEHPTKEEITRALRFSIFKPVKGVPGAEGSSVNIPINFESDKTAVDEQTKPNIEALASVMAEDASGQHFVFIGHADSRGDDNYNVQLSRLRAEAIRDQIVELKPELKGRISVQGHGAREPIDLGTDDEALRRNRRLQVVAKQ
jgi:outer membrane protein OmpA-like peptidoglycan-associated protein